MVYPKFFRVCWARLWVDTAVAHSYACMCMTWISSLRVSADPVYVEATYTLPPFSLKSPRYSLPPWDGYFFLGLLPHDTGIGRETVAHLVIFSVRCSVDVGCSREGCVVWPSRLPEIPVFALSYDLRVESRRRYSSHSPVQGGPTRLS